MDTKPIWEKKQISESVTPKLQAHQSVAGISRNRGKIFSFKEPLKKVKMQDKSFWAVQIFPDADIQKVCHNKSFVKHMCIHPPATALVIIGF